MARRNAKHIDSKKVLKAELHKHTISSPKKPFAFRPRLSHEPPELDYAWFECYDAVQKEFKTLFGPDLAWKTEWLDDLIEELNNDYQE